MLAGLLVLVDGIGSILVIGNQYHGMWYDIERGARAVLGILLILYGWWKDEAGAGRPKGTGAASSQ